MPITTEQFSNIVSAHVHAFNQEYGIIETVDPETNACHCSNEDMSADAQNAIGIMLDAARRLAPLVKSAKPGDDLCSVITNDDLLYELFSLTRSLRNYPANTSVHLLGILANALYKLHSIASREVRDYIYDNNLLYELIQTVIRENKSNSQPQPQTTPADMANNIISNFAKAQCAATPARQLIAQRQGESPEVV